MSGRRTPPRKSAQRDAVGPILIVDDNLDDAALTKRAVESMCAGVSIRVLDSGKALVAYLEAESASPGRTARSLASAILLDMRMPEMDGLAVLQWIRGQPKYAGIPVIIVSAFEDLPHLSQAYALLARAYLLKPIQPESFRDALSSLNITF
jgi:two-component system, response regulator